LVVQRGEKLEFILILARETINMTLYFARAIGFIELEAGLVR